MIADAPASRAAHRPRIPAFELCVNQSREPGSEEYLDSEKYELKTWNLDAPGNLTELIARVNRIRRENPALQADRGLRFHAVDNEQIIAYSKATADNANVILVTVNLDPHHVQRERARRGGEAGEAGENAQHAEPERARIAGPHDCVA